jgi:hypothetical protein
VAATGYLLTAFLIWALVVVIGMASAEPENSPRLPRSRNKRATLRRGLRHSRSTPTGMRVPAAFGLVGARHEELATLTQ